MALKRAAQAKEDLKANKANEVSPFSSRPGTCISSSSAQSLKALLAPPPSFIFSFLWLPLRLQALRRKAGQDTTQIKEDLKKKEALRAAEQIKKDKIADAKAKAAIKLQIEADKKTRAEKFAREKAIRDGVVPVQREGGTDVTSGGPAAVAAATAAAAANSGVKGKDYPETRLQVRLSKGGAPMTKTFSSDAREFLLLTFTFGPSMILGTFFRV